jgi:hypothetical protein
MPRLCFAWSMKTLLSMPSELLLSSKLGKW